MKILIVDDERTARRNLTHILGQLEDVELVEAATRQQAKELLDAGDVDVAMLDLRLGDDPENRDGLALVSEVRAQGRAVPIIVSGTADMGDVRAAMRLGAYDYVLKDELSEELVLPILRGLKSRKALEQEVLQLRSRGMPDPSLGLVGTSSAMQQLRQVIQRVALSDRPVLVTGPTGSGKELAVRAIHALGRRPDEPLLDLNCGAFPETLIESQLFGHEKGAFTGADRKQDGCFTAVRKGTLFLDEIAELPLELQAKLLRVLETGMFRPVGSSLARKFEGRVIAATHADLEEHVARGQFREDLYYRLNVLEVHVPALESRREDVPALLAHFAASQSRPMQFSEQAAEMLCRAPWPGNVRQLRNLVDRLAVFANQTVITPELIGELGGNRRSRPPTNELAELARVVLRLPEGDKLAIVEQVLVDEALRLAGGNKTAAARLLGVHRKVVERRLQRVDTVGGNGALG